MVCLSPLLVKISSTADPRKKSINFNPSFFYDQNGEINFKALDQLPCGRCMSCRLHYMHEWGIRCSHETASSVFNFFVTLTYSPENLPLNGSLCQRDLTLFLKRLRKHFAGNKKSDIRYFACGEYGTSNMRPHYHVIFFNLHLLDLVYATTIKGNRYYRSLTLESLWGKGHILVGSVSYESAAYVAGYSLKKQKGKDRSYYYKSFSKGIISSFKADNSSLSTPLVDYVPQSHVLRRGKTLANLATATDISTGELIFSDLFDDSGNIQYDPLKSDICILQDEFSVMSRVPGIGSAYYEKNKNEMFKNGFIIFEGRRISIPKFYTRKFYETCSDNEFKKAQDARKAYVESLNIPDFDPDYLQKKLVSVEKRLKLFSNRYL